MSVISPGWSGWYWACAARPSETAILPTVMPTDMLRRIIRAAERPPEGHRRGGVSLRAGRPRRPKRPAGPAVLTWGCGRKVDRGVATLRQGELEAVVDLLDVASAFDRFPLQQV